MEGYFLVHRSLFLNDLWDDKPFAYGQAWIDLIGLANHKAGVIFVRGVMIGLERGQVGWSALKLASRWGWSRTKVTLFLNRLEKVHQIVQQKNRITTIISILNYDRYQKTDNRMNNRLDNRKTTERQQKDTNNKCKRMKKNNTETFSPQNNGQLSIANLLADLILRNNPANRELTKERREKTVEKWSQEIDRMIRLDKRNPDYIKQVIVWSENDTFWMKNILSASSLRKHFDQLHLASSKKSSRPGYDENGIPNKVIL